MSVDDAPLVTIGMPVYNGAKYLRESLNAIVHQTYRSLDIIISDNASTDGGDLICAEFARQDERIHLIRQPQNIGGPQNWNAVAINATGKYFKWASANDVCAPGFVAACVAELESNPGAVLCYTETVLMDDNGENKSVYEDPLDAFDRDPLLRFPRVLVTLALNNAQAGLIRTHALHKTHMEGNHPSSDIGLMAELSLYGSFVRLADPLFFRRAGEVTMSANLPEHELRDFFDPHRQKRFTLDEWAFVLGIFRRIIGARVALTQRVQLLPTAFRHMLWRKRALVAELQDECRMLLSRGVKS